MVWIRHAKVSASGSHNIFLTTIKTPSHHHIIILIKKNQFTNKLYNNLNYYLNVYKNAWHKFLVVCPSQINSNYSINARRSIWPQQYYVNKWCVRCQLLKKKYKKKKNQIIYNYSHGIYTKPLYPTVPLLSVSF